MVYASGSQGMDMKTFKLVSGGAGPETKATLTNIGIVLEAAGSQLEDVVRCSVSLVNITRDFAAMNAAYAAFWPKDPPARVTVQVAALAGNASVEIQCDAAVKGAGRAVVKVPGFPSMPMPLSFATTANGMVYLSGTQGRNMTTNKLVSGGAAGETAQIFTVLKEILEAAGSSLDRVVGCSVALANISDFAAMNEVYKKSFPAHGVLGGLPSRVCVEVGALGGNAKVEITCTAAGAEVEPKVVSVPGWPASDLPFSAGTTAAGIAYISGNQGVDMKTRKRAEGGAGPETTQTLANIEKAAMASGTSLTEVVACEVSLRSMKDFDDMNKAYKAFWPGDPPSRIAVEVGALAMGAAVEIKCMAAIPGKATAAEAVAAPLAIAV